MGFRVTRTGVRVFADWARNRGAWIVQNTGYGIQKTETAGRHVFPIREGIFDAIRDFRFPNDLV